LKGNLGTNGSTTPILEADDATLALTAPLTDLADYATLGNKTLVTDERLQDYVANNGDGTGTDDQTASEVSITDSSAYFTSSDVEGALQEIGSDIGSLQSGGSDGNDYVSNVTFSGTDLTFTSSGGGAFGGIVSLAALQDGFEANTDNQTLSLATNTLSISGGNSVDLSQYVNDGFEANTDSQTLSLVGTDLSISGGNTIDVSSLQDGTGTDDQVASEVAVTDVGGYFSGIDVESVLQEIGADLGTFLTAEVDGSITNELQDLTLTSNNLSLTDSAINIDLSPYLDNTDTQLTNEQVQDIIGAAITSLDSPPLGVTYNDPTNKIELSLDTDLSLYDNTTTGFITSGDIPTNNDNDATNEFQDLTLSANNLSLTDSAVNIDLSAYLDNTDDQNATEVNLSPSIDTETTVQAILEKHETRIDNLVSGGGADGVVSNVALSANSLNFTGANGGFNGSIDLSQYVNDGFEANTDNQTLSIATNNLSISGGNSVDLSPYLDDTDTNLTQEEVEDFVGGVISAGSNVTVNYDDVGNNLTISATGDGTGTDDQNLILTGDVLSIENGTGSVDLSTYSDGFEANTDNQTLSLVGSDLSISGGNTVTIPSGADNLGNHIATQNLDLNSNDIIGVGDLGVGTSTPTSKLHALDGTIAEFKFNSGNSSNTPTLAVGNTLANGKFASLLAGTAGSAFFYDISGYFDIVAADKADYNNNSLGSGGASRLRINSSGRVGIGTTNPNEKLHVNGNVLADGYKTPTGTADDVLLANGTTTSLSAIDTDTNLTQEEVEDFVNGVLVGGTNVTLNYDDIGNSLTINASGDGTGTDDQNLILTGDVLSIENGTGSVDLSTYSDGFEANTDSQTLSIVTNNLSISGGNSVDLSPYLDNTDTQLTQEQVQDFALNSINGVAPIQSNYNDLSDRVDISIDTDLSLYDNTTSIHKLNVRWLFIH